MRAALLTTYFPKPANPVMGIWALREAQALQRVGCEVSVVSPTSWVPRLPFLPARLAAWANCPPSAEIESVHVEYPRWPLWQVGALGRFALREPRPQLEFAFRAAHRRLRKKLEAIRPDVIYAHHAATCGWVGAALARELKLPLVVSEHALGLAVYSGFPGMRSVYARVVERANRVVAVSQAMAQIWTSLFPAVRTSVIFNGADPLPREIGSRPRPQALRDRLIIFCTASLHASKGVAELIEAFAPLARENRKLLLRIAGDGPERIPLETQAAKLGLSSQIDFLGRLPHQQILALLAWSDLFALLTRDEAFGVSYLEAMSAGLPVIWSSVAGFRECVVSGVNGIEVEPTDTRSAREALAKLTGDAALRETIGAANRALLESKLTWDAHAEKLIEVFAAVIKEGPR